MDTPGIGSLAREEGAETLAYLPRCDLGVLLIDAATALNQDDLAVLRTLYQAGIPAQVLVSKADLLTSADQQRTRLYVQGQIKRELNVDLQVRLVSTAESDEALLARWFDQEIEPLFQRHAVLTEKSLQRKISHLRESLIAVLQTMASGRGEAGEAGHADADARLADIYESQAEVLREQVRGITRRRSFPFSLPTPNPVRGAIGWMPRSPCAGSIVRRSMSPSKRRSSMMII